MTQRSVSVWIDQLKAGDREATRPLWENYFRRLVGLARARLADRPRLGADAEDVALSAFDSFIRGVERGRFPELRNRDELWHLLVTITARKAQRLLRDETRQKRGGGAVQGESVFFDPAGGNGAKPGIEQVLGRDPSPEFVVQLTDEFERLFGTLADADLRRVATMKLEGYTIDEMAARIGRAPATIERKLKVIRALWERELE